MGRPGRGSLLGSLGLRDWRPVLGWADRCKDSHGLRLPKLKCVVYQVGGKVKKFRLQHLNCLLVHRVSESRSHVKPFACELGRSRHADEQGLECGAWQLATMRGRQTMASEPYMGRLKLQAGIPWTTQKSTILWLCPLPRDLRVMLLGLEAGGCHHNPQEREGQHREPREEHRHQKGKAQRGKKAPTMVRSRPRAGTHPAQGLVGNRYA